MNCQSSNGRVDIFGPNIADQFSMHDKIPVSQCSSFRDAMIGNWEDSNLSRTFFSRENMQIIQNGIRAGVHKVSNGAYIIDDQDCDALKIIMRSTFLQNATNKPCDIPEQINALNQLVLDYCVPHVYGEAQGYINYKRDASTMYHPVSYPVAPDFNNKTLELKHWF